MPELPEIFLEQNMGDNQIKVHELTAVYTW